MFKVVGTGVRVFLLREISQFDISFSHVVNLNRLYPDDDVLKLMPLAVFPTRLRRSNSGTYIACLWASVLAYSAVPITVTVKGVAIKSLLAAVKPTPAAVKPTPAAVICHAFLPDNAPLPDPNNAPWPNNAPLPDNAPLPNVAPVPDDVPMPDDAPSADFIDIDLAAYRADLLAAPPVAGASTSAHHRFASASPLTGLAYDSYPSPLTGPLYELPPLPMAFPPAPHVAISPEPFPPIASGSGSHPHSDPSMPTSTTRDKGKNVYLGDYLVNTIPGTPVLSLIEI